MKHRHRSEPVDGSQPETSTGGWLIGWAIFGGLVLVGFVFGVVIGYESPRPVVVAKAPPESLKPAETPALPKVEPKKVEQAPLLSESQAEKPIETPPKADPSVRKSSVATPKKVEPKSQAMTPVSFQKEVLPILRAHCLNCHGGGTGKPKADVNLTSIASMRRSPGKILVPGKPDESDVYTSITEREMPDGGRPKPTARELTTLRNWILAGAKERRRIVRRRGVPAPR